MVNCHCLEIENEINIGWAVPVSGTAHPISQKEAKVSKIFTLFGKK